jgi:Ion channel
LAIIPELLSKIPDEYKPIAALVIGAFILVFLALFHGFGLHRILLQNKRGERRRRFGRPRLVAASLLFGWIVFLMLALHLVEILIWSFALTWTGLIQHAYDAIYFCANSYTTLGQGKVDVDKNWRIISPIIGISGLFTFAWTTSALVDVVTSYSRLLEQLEDEREREMHLRSALRKEEWGALKKGRAAVQSERERTKIRTAGASFFQRLRIWTEERRKVEDLRHGEAEEIGALRQKERSEEERLGPGVDSDDKE